MSDHQPTDVPPPPADDAPTAEQDRYWLDHVFAGDTQRQLTVRAVLTGCLIGGLMSVSNLYVGLKIGWGLGVAITSAVLAFTLFRTLETVLKYGPDKQFSILENNTMQTAASAAGYMSSAGLVSAIPALWMVSKYQMPLGQIMVWVAAVSLLGIVAAIPVKRKLINEERLRFPSGIAAAETLRSLHTAGSEGTAKGKALAVAGAMGGVVAFLREGLKWLPDKYPVFGKAMALRSIAFEPSLVMIAAGALMGLRVTFWMVVAGLASRYWLADWLLAQGYIGCGKLAPGTICSSETLNYSPINAWTLWPGVSLMVVHSLVALSLQAPKMIAGIVKTLRGAPSELDPRLAAIEVPTSWFLRGLAVVGTLCVGLQWAWFDIAPLWGALAVVLSMLLVFVAARSLGETDTNPVGSMGKVTQLVFGGVMAGNINANLLAANVTAGAASHGGDLLTDLKAGYLLGARPRYQVVAQFFGVLVGAVFASAAYVYLINPNDLGGEKWPAPAAQVWATVAKLLSQGIDKLEPHKLVAIEVAAAVGAFFAIVEAVASAKIKRWLPSISGIGIAMTVGFVNTFSMFIGACVAWAVQKRWPDLAERFTVVAASGFIAGETLLAVGILAYRVATGQM